MKIKPNSLEFYYCGWFNILCIGCLLWYLVAIFMESNSGSKFDLKPLEFYLIVMLFSELLSEDKITNLLGFLTK